MTQIFDTFRIVLVAQADALEAQAATLRALAKQAPAAVPVLVAVSMSALEPFRLGVTCVRAAIDAGELRGILGSRRRLHVDAAELVAWRDSRPVRPRPPRKSRPIGVNIDPIDAMIEAGELVARRGAR